MALAIWGSGGLGIVSMATSTLLVMGVAILFALMAAMLRTWAVAYMGSPVVQDSVLHAERIPAGGPYRYIRNQLYVGLWLYAMAVVILMPPGGALFVMLAVTLLIVALVHAAESSLAAHHGEAYAQYLRAVPVSSRLFRLASHPAMPGRAGCRHFWRKSTSGVSSSRI